MSEMNEQNWSLDDLAAVTRSDDGPGLTLAQLVAAFGFAHALEIIEAAAGGMLPTREYARRVLARLRFERLWREHLAAGRARFPTGRAARFCGASARTIERWIREKVA